MLRVLNAEGHAIKERELMRVRAKHRWLLRVPNGTKTFGGGTTSKAAKGTKRKRAAETSADTSSLDGFSGGLDMHFQELAAAHQVQALQQQNPQDAALAQAKEEAEEEGLSPEVIGTSFASPPCM